MYSNIWSAVKIIPSEIVIRVLFILSVKLDFKILW